MEGLPVDCLEKICVQLPKQDLRAVSLTSRSLSETMMPLLQRRRQMIEFLSQQYMEEPNPSSLAVVRSIRFTYRDLRHGLIRMETFQGGNRHGELHEIRLGKFVVDKLGDFGIIFDLVHRQTTAYNPPWSDIAIEWERVGAFIYRESSSGTLLLSCADYLDGKKICLERQEETALAEDLAGQRAYMASRAKMKGANN